MTNRRSTCLLHRQRSALGKGYTTILVHVAVKLQFSGYNYIAAECVVDSDLRIIACIIAQSQGCAVLYFKTARESDDMISFTRVHLDVSNIQC